MAPIIPPPALAREQLSRWFKPGARVYWPGAAGHSPLFEEWLREEPGLAAGVWFCGAWLPGINRFDPTALHADARATAFFLAPEFHAAWQRGALDFLPLHYSAVEDYLGTPGRFDVLMLHVAPPDDAGLCSLALAADFTPAVLQGLAAGATVLAHINPALPRTRGPAVPLHRITAAVYANMPPLTLADEVPSATLAAVAQQVARQVRDGDTLQFGVGRLQTAVLAALGSHQRLRLHSGMVSDGLLGLMQAGALAPLSLEQPPVCTGVALGGAALYEAMADPALVQFAPVSQTHGQAALAAVPE